MRKTAIVSALIGVVLLGVTNVASAQTPGGNGRILYTSKSGSIYDIYVMNADGGNVQRISFGQGRYGTPVWSPRGDVIAYTRLSGGQFYIGVIRPDGSGERQISSSWHIEGPSWSPNGRVLTFFRAAQGSGQAQVWSVDLTGVNERRIPTPLDGSDPSWGPLRP